jgi:hypothetical protein
LLFSACKAIQINWEKQFRKSIRFFSVFAGAPTYDFGYLSLSRRFWHAFCPTNSIKAPWIISRSLYFGGERGIRTLGQFYPSHDFQISKRPFFAYKFLKRFISYPREPAQLAGFFISCYFALISL